MLKNYFTIAWRNLMRNKAFSFINIFGLATGMAVCLIITLFVSDELSYDKFNTKANRMVRVTFGGKLSGEVVKEAVVMAPVAQTLQHDYPEVEEATRLLKNSPVKISYQEKTFEGETTCAVDSNFFSVFTLPFVKGNAQTALTDLNAVVITEDAARRYFGDEDPMGKLLVFKTYGVTKKVTGVIKSIPANAHFHFDFFSSLADVPEARSTSFLNGSYYTYLVLAEGFDYKKLQAKLPQMTEKYMGPQLKQAIGMDMETFSKKGNEAGFYLQPLTDIHLRSNFAVNLEPGGDIQYVYIFGVTALFMLLIACINFMNLSTAGASKRAKEVGIRKVLGSAKSALIRQFLFESILLAVIASVTGLMLARLGLPVFNHLANKNLSLRFLSSPLYLAGYLAFAMVIGMMAGSYPAFFLSSFKPVAVLKSKFISRRKTSLRSGLVVFQFFISVMLIIGTVVVYEQLNYIRHMKLGFNKDQVLVLRNTAILGNREALLKQQLLNDQRVLNVSNGGYLPVAPIYNDMTLTFPDGNTSLSRRTNVYKIDHRYIATMGMQLAAGRNFSGDLRTDSSCVIVNETLASIYGWGVHAAGHTLNFSTNLQGSAKGLQVIGVVKDFNFQSLHEPIGPVMMVLQRNPGLIIRTKGKDIPGLLSAIKAQWKTFGVDEPVKYSFLDEDYTALYQAEDKTGTILSIFAVLTIFVACLGLFGLATFTAEQRTKEIGIRKTLGANVGQVVMLLSGYFLKLVMIACAFAFPVAWFIMHKWLQDFAYRFSISWWVFVMAGAGAILVALATVSFQAIKAAVANPINSLRTE
ncbi:ABC transporter permease [Deminuibacter soli]|uniref:ABC transporter permease n=1 Tax=Deminuibacter soli TaxID=2291815 RepID=A0A3E1NLA6_9BACT|nr:ABC transporter permease [Deminuibacter soli]RFM28568.1 ABC transporter permease [Deminuibacter soli]